MFRGRDREFWKEVIGYIGIEEPNPVLPELGIMNLKLEICSYVFLFCLIVDMKGSGHILNS